MAKIRHLIHSEARNLLDPETRVVDGAAAFYEGNPGWVKIRPGTLGLIELYGGAGGVGNQPGTSAAVEFYVAAGGERDVNTQTGNFVALDGSQGDYFMFHFNGRVE